MKVHICKKDYQPSSQMSGSIEKMPPPPYAPNAPSYEVIADIENQLTNLENEIFRTDQTVRTPLIRNSNISTNTSVPKPESSIMSKIAVKKILLDIFVLCLFIPAIVIGSVYINADCDQYTVSSYLIVSGCYSTVAFFAYRCRKFYHPQERSTSCSEAIGIIVMIGLLIYGSYEVYPLNRAVTECPDVLHKYSLAYVSIQWGICSLIAIYQCYIR
jgi:hypothetical protein